MKASEFLLSLFTGTLENVGETKLEALLQDLHDKHPDQYEVAIKGGRLLVKALLPIAAKTGTKIDDAIVKALAEAIEDSAAANGTILED